MRPLWKVNSTPASQPKLSSGVRLGLGTKNWSVPNCSNMVGSFTAVPTLACGRMLISRSTSEAAARQVVKSWKLSLSSWRMPAVRNSRSAKPPRHSPV